jgi:ABC-type transport system substrate-binding protein
MAAVKDALAQVGIELNIETVPSATLFDSSSSASDKALVNRQFDIVEFAWVSSYDPGTDAIYNMHSASIPSKSNGYIGGNYGDYKNARSDQLLDQLSQSIDPSFRVIALKEAQTIWQSDLPVLPLVLRPITTVASSRLMNFRPTPAPAGETWNVEQWDLASPPAS